jgi:hypothetical protein
MSTIIGVYASIYTIVTFRSHKAIHFERQLNVNTRAMRMTRLG